MQAHSIAAEVLFEHGRIQVSQFADCLDSKFRQSLFSDFPDSRQAPDRQGQEENINVIGLDNKEPIGLAPVRGELCQEFVWRHARRGSQVQFLTDLLTDCARYKRCSEKAGLVLGDVQVSFIERQGLDQFGVTLEYLPHFT